MHSQAVVAEVLALRKTGLGARRISGLTGLPVGTVRDWLAGRLPTHSRELVPGEPIEPACARCGHSAHHFAELPSEYIYLLGLYFGDGTISAHRRSVFRLRIFLDLRYPLIIDACVRAMETVVPTSKVSKLKRRGNFAVRDEPSNVEVSAYSKSWVCLFPQHGPGKKHERSIALTDWQFRLVDQWPEQLLRGLIHSDGCRFINTGRGNWRCPRYCFNNRSTDILDIFCYGCDRLGLRWTRSGQRDIYVSRKADVARLDEFIGPKA